MRLRLLCGAKTFSELNMAQTSFSSYLHTLEDLKGLGREKRPKNLFFVATKIKHLKVRSFSKFSSSILDLLMKNIARLQVAYIDFGNYDYDFFALPFRDVKIREKNRHYCLSTAIFVFHSFIFLMSFSACIYVKKYKIVFCALL